MARRRALALVAVAAIAAGCGGTATDRAGTNGGTLTTSTTITWKLTLKRAKAGTRR